MIESEWVKVANQTAVLTQSHLVVEKAFMCAIFTAPASQVERRIEAFRRAVR